ncbi:MAG: hypothetical protein F7C32_04030 [Desulfurococcales archaeon]|nr:hypothetical protein [Desulfurococcales archaeon]
MDVESSDIYRVVLESVKKVLTTAGFETEQGVSIAGKSGINWTVDVYGKSYCRLFDLTVAVIIVLDEPITKEKVSLYAYMKNDVNIDKVLLVTNRKVDFDAKKIAKSIGLSIVDVSRLATVAPIAKTVMMKPQLKRSHISPAISHDEMMKKLRCEKTLLGGCKRKLIDTVLVYLPLYSYTITLELPHKGTHEIEFNEHNVTFESVKGSMINVDEDGTIQIERAYANLGELSFEVMEVIRYIVEHGPLTKEELFELVAVDEKKLERILLILLDKMLVDIYGDTYTIRQFTIPARYRSVSDFYKDKLKTGIPADHEIINPRVSLDKLEYFLSIFGEVSDRSIIYYPLYVAIYEKPGTIVRIKVFDGNTGERLEEFEELLEHTDVLRKIGMEYEHKIKHGE